MSDLKNFIVLNEWFNFSIFQELGRLNLTEVRVMMNLKFQC